MVDKEQVMDALRDVMDPELNRSIVELNMVDSVDITEDRIDVHVLLTVEGCPLRHKIQQDVRGALQPLPGINVVNVTLGTMTDEQRERLVSNNRGQKDAKSRVMDDDSPTTVIAIASGKGGVGKSTVTANLAAALYREGFSVGILDADIYGFSIPTMMGVEGHPKTFNGAIAPMYAHGMQVMSMGFLVEKGTPVVWRGPMLMRAVEQFLTDVLWGDPDYLLLDLPPGTGDVPLTICQKLPRSKLVVVTTPQPAAFSVAVRAAGLARKANQEVMGVIENMSYYICPDCGDKEYLFGSGGGERLSEELNVPLFGQIPLEPAVRHGSDEGTPIVISNPESASAESFRQIAAGIQDYEPQEQPQSAQQMVQLEDRL